MSLLLLRSEQPAYHCTLCLTGHEWLQSGVHLRRPDQVVKRDSDSPERLSAFARPRLYCTSWGNPPFSFAGVAPRASKVVYYVIALALYMRSSYREVLRCLLEGVHWLLDPSTPARVAGKSSISQARTRL